MARRLGLILAALAAPASLAGCGEKDRVARSVAPVRLAIAGPVDGARVEGDTVDVRGTVRPQSARVLVDGDEAPVSGGAFTVSVELDPGVNVIDVVAGARDRRSAMTALRVMREVPVVVPDVEGQSPEEARARLQGRGLVPEVKRGGGLIDELLPGTLGVCGTDPDAGERVKPGSTVVVTIAKTC